MRGLSFFVAMAAILVSSAFTAFTVANSYQVAEGYSIKFVNPEATGTFSKLTGSVAFDENNVANSSFNMSVEVASINTGNGMKNKHAKSDTWFDAKQFPNITFVSSKFAKNGSTYEVTGTLNIHGIAKEVTIPFTFENNTFSGKFSVNRLEYKVGNMEGMSKKVPDAIGLEIAVPVTKK